MSSTRCAEAEAVFLDDLDGRLDPAASLRLHAHLESCAACRERAALWGWLTPELRRAEPAPLNALAARRMQVEVERRLAAPDLTPREPRRPGLWIPALVTAMAAAAAIAVGLHGAGRPAAVAPAAPATYATVARVRGRLATTAGPLDAQAPVPAGQPLALADGAEAELALPRGTTLTVAGPAHLQLDGTAAATAVRLQDGRLTAAVAHRLPGETFAVVTGDLRVVVKGTRFSVTAGAPGSRVAVEEGAVVVEFADGRTRSVAAGESASTEPPAPAASAAPDRAPRPLIQSDACPAAAQSCQDTAEAVRAGMRGGDTGRALRILAERGRAIVELDPRCGGHAFSACQDDLRYLRAEALNQAGRLDEAVAAYRALDRRGAPAAMKQNALYAAAQIERRRGRNQSARADYERAIGAAPRGGLREEAFIGAMESADAGGDRSRARALARRYLAEFPRGLATASATRLAGR